MNREIKFRKWNGAMHYCEGRLEAFFACMEPGDVLMQYTGLKDKNGKGIWEGDIVKVRNWTPSGQKATYSHLVVEWLAIGGSDDMGTDMIGFRDHSGHEVIGNRFENPDLIKP